jgi:hypothetical protein
MMHLIIGVIIGIFILAALLVYAPRVVFVAFGLFGLLAFLGACLLWGSTVLLALIIPVVVFVLLRAWGRSLLHIFVMVAEDIRLHKSRALEWREQQERKQARIRAIADLG